MTGPAFFSLCLAGNPVFTEEFGTQLLRKSLARPKIVLEFILLVKN